MQAAPAQPVVIVGISGRHLSARSPASGRAPSAPYRFAAAALFRPLCRRESQTASPPFFLVGAARFASPLLCAWPELPSSAPPFPLQGHEMQERVGYSTAPDPLLSCSIRRRTALLFRDYSPNISCRVSSGR